MPPLTRRRIVYGCAFGLGSALCGPVLRARAEGGEKGTSGNDHRTSLHQEVDLGASVAEIEATLLTAEKFRELTRLAAQIEPTEGAAFSLFGGLIMGRNIEIVPAKRIVQAWRPTHWEPGMYSMVRFALVSKGAGTTIVLDHTGFPEGDYESLSQGWETHYWEPLRNLFH